MRRTEREVTDRAFMEQVLREAEVLWIAWNTGGVPYVLPVNFIWLEGALWFHCAREGRKMDVLRADPRVGFSAAVDIRVEGTTSRYRSVCGEGVAALEEDPVVRDRILRAFAARYAAPCRFPVSPQKDAVTGLVRIAVTALTGKHSHAGEGPRPMPHYVD